MNCDLMDGRDAFLTMARDKHFEFSSMRRAQFSTLCMLYELHNQGQDKFVYTCNHCKNHVETRYHCTVCEVRTSALSLPPSYSPSPSLPRRTLTCARAATPRWATTTPWSGWASTWTTAPRPRT